MTYILFPFDYLRVFLFLLFIGLLLIIMLILTFALSYKSSYKDADKLSSYECGFEPFEDTRSTFDVQFYLIAIIFIVFDVEIAFLYPWIITLREFTDLSVFLTGFVFFLFVIIGFIFEWYQGAFDWKMSNLSKIQLFALLHAPYVENPPHFTEIQAFFPDVVIEHTPSVIILTLGVVLIGIFFLTTVESTLIVYSLFILTLIVEAHWALAGIFSILLIVLFNFWITLDHNEYNVDSKIIIAYNIYAVISIFLIDSYNLFEIFLAMEGLSLTLVIMIAYKTQRFSALEAAIKYFVQSSIVGCFFSLSTALIYLTTSTFFINDLFGFMTYNNEYGSYIETSYNPFLIYACVVLTLCIFFKLSIFPAHVWTPDVYTGSPLMVTTVFATVNKLIFFYIFLKIASCSIFPFFGSILWKFFFSPILQISALSSIVIGALGAFRQTTIKRFFGYTTINTLGFILLPIAVNGLTGVYVSFSYLIIYIAMSVLFFNLISKIYVSRSGEFNRVYFMSDFAGLYKNNKIVVFVISFIMLVFSGLPPYLTFYNKYFILQLISSSLINIYFLSILLLTTIITTYYYIRFIKGMFFEQPKLSQVLQQIDTKYTNRVLPIEGNVVVLTTAKIELIFVSLFIVFGPDIFELIKFLI